MILGALAAVLMVAAAGASPAPAPSPAGGVVAVVGGREVTRAELDARASASLIEPETRAWEARREALEALIDDELVLREAARRGMTVDALVRAEVDAKAVPVTDWDARAHYEAHRADFEGQPEERALQLVRERLADQRRVQRRFGFLRALRAQAGVAVSLEPPRLAMTAGDYAFRGPADAPVTIVEFSDFECPFCRRVQPTLARLRAAYPKGVRLVYRHFPLARHRAAPKAAEAAECAREQGRFWEMHDRLFANPDALGVEDLKRHARAISLHDAAFDACLDSGRHDARWRRDLAEALTYGSSGTPLFFVNGRLIVGAQPYDVFARVVEEELKAPRR